MKEIPKAGFVCTGESALELSGAICCAGKLMNYFNENGYITGGCYSCISPSKQINAVRERLYNMCACNDVVVTIGCEGFRNGDVIPDITESLSTKSLAYFGLRLSGEEYTDIVGNVVKKCFPSRATAAFCAGAVIVNLPSDSAVAVGKLAPLMEAIGFAMENSGKKADKNTLDFDNLMSEYYCQSGFQE